MKRDPQLYLDDILESINLINQYLEDVTEEQFHRSTEKQDSIVRRLEIIGEATKNIPHEITKGCPRMGGYEKNTNANPQYQDGYCVEYTGDGVLNFPQSRSNFYRITVGKSTQDLQPFINKDVIITSGKFVFADKQCIANNICLLADLL